MTWNRMLGLVVLAALSTAAVLLWGGRPSSGSVPIETLRTAVPSTTGPDISAVVSDMAQVFEEVELIEEAVSIAAEASTTTTMPSSTTTTDANPTTTATSASATTASSSASSPSSPSSPSSASSSSSTSPPATSPPSTIASGYVSAAESDFAGRIASYRSSSGQGALARDGSLDSYARAWAKTLAERGQLSHSNFGSLAPPWAAVGENVGMGGSVGAIFNALAGSSGHRANMLGDFTHFGVGVYQASDGSLWTAHVFAR